MREPKKCFIRDPCWFTESPTVTEQVSSNHVFIHTAPPCKPGLDVGLVLDKSSSISIRKGHLQEAIDFLGKLVEKFDPAPDADHFGLITFNRKANLMFPFAESQLHDKNALLEKIANEPIETKGGTRTDLALAMARDELFTKEGGDRPDKPNVVILLTDGKPDNLDETIKEAKDFEVSTLRLSIATCILLPNFSRE